MNGRKIRVAWLVVLAVAVTAAGVLWRLKGSKEAGSGPGEQPAPRGQLAPMPARVSGGATSTNATGVSRPVAAATGHAASVKGKPLTAEEQQQESDEADRVIAKVQEDLDSSDMKVIVAAARKLMDHPNPKVRLRAVAAFAWTRSEGFPELSRMLLDDDTDVAGAAMEAWALQMQMIEFSPSKTKLFEEVGKTAIAKGEDAFQFVLDAMFDMPDAAALKVLQTYAAQTDDPAMLEKIIDRINFRLPDDEVKGKGDIARAIDAFLKREAEQAAPDNQAK